jgi:hypothetical protein
MRVVEQTPDRLVLCGRPVVIFWVAASLLLVGVLFVFAVRIVGLFGPLGEPGWVDWGMPALGGAAILASVVVFLCAIWVTLTLDRPTNSLRLERAGWFGRSEQAEALSAVEDAVVETTTDSEGSTLYRAALRLTDGRTLLLTHGYDNFEQSKRAAVEAIRRFLGRANNV